MGLEPEEGLVRVPLHGTRPGRTTAMVVDDRVAETLVEPAHRGRLFAQLADMEKGPCELLLYDVLGDSATLHPRRDEVHEGEPVRGQDGCH